MMKMMKNEENNSKSTDGLSGRAGVGKMDGKPAMGAADMKDFMRN